MTSKETQNPQDSVHSQKPGEEYFKGESSNYVGGYENMKPEIYWRPILNQIKNYLEPGEEPLRMADIGCAYGYLLKYAQEALGSDRELVRVGTDLSRFALTQAKEEAGDADGLVEQNLDQGLPLASEALDVATALDVVEHTQNRQFSVDEVARVLKPGGVAVISVPVKDTWAGKFVWEIIGDQDPTHISIPTRDEIIREIENAGLTVAEKELFWPLMFLRTPIPTNMEIVAIKKPTARQLELINHHKHGKSALKSKLAKLFKKF